MTVVDSTFFLKPLLPEAGTLTLRAPDADEAADIAYGREIAKKDCGLGPRPGPLWCRTAPAVAVEAMEGTDAAIQRAANLE